MRFIKEHLKKQRVNKYEDIILDVERIVGVSKLPLVEVYREIYKRTNDKTFKKIADRIGRGEDKLSVYRDYLSSEIYLILREGEKRNLPVYRLLENIHTVRILLEQTRKKIYSSLNFGIGYFVFISVIGYFLLNRIVLNLGSIELVGDKKIIEFTMGVYPFVVISLFIGILLLFYVFKYKTPFIRKIFIDSELTTILVLTKIMYAANIPIKSIIEYFASSKSYFTGRFRSLSSADSENFVSVYIEAIKDELEPKEFAMLELAFKAGRFRDMLTTIADERMSKVKEKTEKYSKTLLYFAISLSIIPIGFLLTSYIDIIMQITKSVLEIMNKG